MTRASLRRVQRAQAAEARRGRAPLPDADCVLGYTRAQVEQLVGDRLAEFERWMDGQTAGLCNAEFAGCGGVAHGCVVYAGDLERFLAGLPVVD